MSSSSLPGATSVIDRLQLRFLHIVSRNFLVWRKLMYASLVGNLAAAWKSKRPVKVAVRGVEIMSITMEK